MPETQSNTPTQLECLTQGIQYHNEKAVLSKEMNTIAKACSDECGIDKKTIIKVKDYEEASDKAFEVVGHICTSCPDNDHHLFMWPVYCRCSAKYQSPEVRLRFNPA